MDDRTIILKPYGEFDFESFASLVSDPENMRHAGGVLDRRAARRLFDLFLQPMEIRRLHASAIVSEGEYAGHCAIKLLGGAEAELIVVVNADSRRKRIGTSAARRAIHLGFRDLGLTRIIATVDLDNIAAIRLCESCGFEFAGREEDDEGEYLVYSISASD